MHKSVIWQTLFCEKCTLKCLLFGHFVKLEITNTDKNTTEVKSQSKLLDGIVTKF